MTSPSRRKAVPALSVLLLLLTLGACGGTNSGTSSGSGALSAVALQPAAVPSIAVGGTVQVGANAAYQGSSTNTIYKDMTSSAIWSSSDTAVATVSDGLVTGTGIGSATITASLDGKTGTTVVVVGQALTLEVTPTTPGTFSVSANRDQHFQALAHYPDGSALDLTHYTIWSSSLSGVLAFYDPSDYTHAPGEALLVAPGTTTVTATLDIEHVGSVNVIVLP